VANRCWSSLQVNGMSPNGAGWRACSTRAATTRKAYASMARVTHRYQERQRQAGRAGACVVGQAPRCEGCGVATAGGHPPDGGGWSANNCESSQRCCNGTTPTHHEPAPQVSRYPAGTAPAAPGHVDTRTRRRTGPSGPSMGGADGHPGGRTSYAGPYACQWRTPCPLDSRAPSACLACLHDHPLSGSRAAGRRRG
jgi:hypothetical protein